MAPALAGTLIQGPYKSHAERLRDWFGIEALVLVLRPDGILDLSWVWSRKPIEGSLTFVPAASIEEKAKELALHPEKEQQIVMQDFYPKAREHGLRSRLDVGCSALWTVVLGILHEDPVIQGFYSVLSPLVEASLTIGASRMVILSPATTPLLEKGVKPIQVKPTVHEAPDRKDRLPLPLLVMPDEPLKTTDRRPDVRTAAHLDHTPETEQLFFQIEQVLLEALAAAIRYESARLRALWDGNVDLSQNKK